MCVAVCVCCVSCDCRFVTLRVFRECALSCMFVVVRVMCSWLYGRCVCSWQLCVVLSRVLCALSGSCCFAYFCLFNELYILVHGVCGMWFFVCVVCFARVTDQCEQFWALRYVV